MTQGREEEKIKDTRKRRRNLHQTRKEITDIHHRRIGRKRATRSRSQEKIYDTRKETRNIQQTSARSGEEIYNTFMERGKEEYLIQDTRMGYSKITMIIQDTREKRGNILARKIMLGMR